MEFKDMSLARHLTISQVYIDFWVAEGEAGRNWPHITVPQVLTTSSTFPLRWGALVSAQSRRGGPSGQLSVFLHPILLGRKGSAHW